MEIEVIAGDIANNPIVLGEIATIAQRGNSGSTEILQWPFAAESASYSLRAQGKIVDTRINGNWPKLQKKWFTKRKNFQLAITYGDNLAPAVYPPSLSSWEQKCSSLDLLLHLGDFVYEQSYRRRLEVSHLDYLTILGTTIGQRNRSLPMVGVFDDHEIANDVLGCGEPHWFGTFPTGTNLPKINPWRVASRDVGTKAWENFVGWSTPIEKEYKKIPHIFGQGILSLDGTVFIKNRKVISQLKALDVSLLSSLIIWPKALPEKFTELLTEPAGVYRVKKVHHNGFSIDLSPIPRSLLKLWRKKKFAIDFSISKPRFGSLKLGTAELLLLDTRTEKGFWQVDAKQPGPSILGKRQKKWLLHKIKHSPASLLLIASSITFTFHNGFTLQKRDSWTAFGHERDVLLRTIAARNKPVLLLSGDLHASAIRQLNDKIYELVCGAWSNQTFSNISASQEPIKGFAAPRLLYSSSDGKEKRGWETHITFLEFSHTGQVKVIIFNIATEKVEYQKVLF